MAWSDDAARYLLDTSVCPRCGARLTDAPSCPLCAAELSGPAGAEVWAWSQKAAWQLQKRQMLIDALPTASPTDAHAPAAAPVAAASAPSSAVPASGEPAAATARYPAPSPTGQGASDQISLQSVLAVAGAGLVAVAAIVFTFLNPEVGFAMRTFIIAITTAAFLGGAWLLARRGLTFSAEAIGGLGMVFLALDVWAFSEGAPPEVSGWVFAGIGLLVAGAGLIAIGWIVRLRTWLWAGVVGVSIAPAFFGYAGQSAFAAVAGHLVVGFVALAGHVIVRRCAARFDSALRADHVTIGVLQFAVLAVVVLQAPLAGLGDWQLTREERIVGVATAYAALVVFAVLSTRFALVRFWSATAGVLAVAAVAVLSQVPASFTGAWTFTVVPLGAALVLTAACVLRPPGSVRPSALRWGAFVATMLVSTPSAFVALGTIVSSAIVVRGRPAEFADVVLAAILGLVAVAAAVWAVSRFHRGAPARWAAASAVLARWIGALALLAVPGWLAPSAIAAVAAALATSLLAGAALVLPPRVRSSRTALRAPLIAVAHIAIGLAIALSWPDERLVVGGGLVVIAAIAAAARTLPQRIRPLHMGVGFAYTLIVSATAFDLIGLDGLAVLCLTTTLAAALALVATLTDWLRPGMWYAVLVVTSVPFLIGVATVLVERSGWTALSTAMIFLLAAALVGTRRPGLTPVLRAAAGALLVPTLAVVVVCLAAWLLEDSGSPVALPVIAVIVAAVLPSTGPIGAALAERGLSAREVRLVAIAIEASALLTAAIAVLLAVVGVAGLETAFVVLVVIGIGAGAAAFWQHRRYGWWVASAAWTGALCARWAIAGVDVVEPYVLPPALAAAIVGTVLVFRGRRGVALAATGIASAVVPSLALLTLIGSGADTTAPWRAIGLLIASAALLSVAYAVTGTPPDPLDRLAPLGRPTAIVAIAAAGAGALQGIRYGVGADAAPAGAGQPLVIVLGFAAAAVVLAAAGGALLVRDGVRTRWVHAAAVVFLVAGPITAVRPEPFPIWMLWALSIALLGLAVATTLIAARRPVTLPPVWFVWAIAWCTAVASWSQREILRVEGYSLPLGAALLLVGILAMRQPAHERARFVDWPNGFSGSWRLLSPGIVVLMLPSVLATATDPTTWRAILVIALALAAILIGAVRKLAAPFILGLAVLPIENVVVFAVQVGRDIQSMPWWITLATAGAVLLVIAVTTERRTGADRGVAARLRDLT